MFPFQAPFEPSIGIWDAFDTVRPQRIYNPFQFACLRKSILGSV